jgi:8-oxo-dGTP diphosphatase
MDEEDMPVDVAAAATFDAEKEKFLVMKRAESMSVNPGKWDFPSGKIEEGEDARTAALRELREETGLKGEILKSGDSFVQETRDGKFKVHPFLVLVEDSEVEMNSEHTECRWVELCDLENLETVAGLKKDLEKVGVEK